MDLTLLLVPRTFLIFFSIELISYIYLRYSLEEIIPLDLASLTAIRYKTVIWVVKAFVEATPISGPAWVYDPALTSLLIEEPTTLHIPYKKAPSFLASFIAANVTAVSPDCEIAIIISVFLLWDFDI